MPLITVKMIEGVFDPDAKLDLIGRLTDAVVSIEGEALRPVTWVVLEEVGSGDWGMGGNPMTTQKVQQLQMQPVR
ncbi:MAG: 4-oxalocrotonate tautomerase family protein [Nocardioidaceae bacterium]